MSPEEYAKSEGWEVVHRFTIPRVGWETDNEGVIARDHDATLRCITTNHGGIRVDAEDLGFDGGLVELREQLRRWTDEVSRAVAMLENGGIDPGHTEGPETPGFFEAGPRSEGRSTSQFEEHGVSLQIHDGELRITTWGKAGDHTYGMPVHDLMDWLAQRGWLERT